MPTITGPVVGLDSAAAQQLEQIVASFEANWHSGQRPNIAAFLNGSTGLRSALLSELAVLDLEFRLRAGESARAEEYLHQFPDFPGEAIPDLVEAEYLGRRLREPQLDVNEFLHRFPGNRSTLADRLQLTAPAARTSERILEKPVIPGYEILELLGRGATGHVFKALDQRLGRFVAIKVLSEDADADQRERFRRESTAAAQLHHSNIVAIFEVGATKSGRPYLVLEFVPGGTLQTRLLTGPMTPTDSAAALEILAQAVAHAHQHGIIHRDLKPANILIGAAPHDPFDAGSLKITDFGLARATNSPLLTKTGVVIGTPAYMSPEQADGTDATPQSDVYALGAVLYECLVGRPPFRGATVLETLDQVRRLEPVPVRELQPSVPRDLETIALKCLHKEPSRRYASAHELAADLARFRAGQPIHARPTSSIERLILWARRNPLAAGLTTAIALLLMAMTGGAIAFGIRQSQLATIAEGHRLDAEQATIKERNRRKELRSTLDRMTSMALADIALTGPITSEQREFFVAAQKQFAAFANEAGATPEDQMLAAQAAARVADIHRRLGDLHAASETYDRAGRMIDDLLATDPTNRQFLVSAMVTHFHRGTTLDVLRQWDDVLVATQRTMQLAKELAIIDPESYNARNYQLKAAILTMVILQRQGRIAEGLALLDQTESLLTREHDNMSKDLRLGELVNLNQLGNVAKRLGQQQKAEQIWLRAIPLAEWLEANDFENTESLQQIGQTYYHYAQTPSIERNTGSKNQWLDRAIKVNRQALRLTPMDSELRRGLAMKLRLRANTESDANVAIQQLQEAVELLTVVVHQGPADFSSTRTLAQIHSQLGLALVKSQRIDAARKSYDLSAQYFEKLQQAEPNAWEPILGMGGLLVNRALLEKAATGPSAAIPLLNRAIDLLEKAAAYPAAEPNAKRFLRYARFERAILLNESGQFANALADWDAALGLKTTLADERNLRIHRTRALIGIQDYDQARRELEDTLALPSATNNERWIAAKVYGIWTLDERDTADRRTEALRKSSDLIANLHRAGFFRNPANAAALKQTPELDAVRRDPRVLPILQSIDTTPRP